MEYILIKVYPAIISLALGLLLDGDEGYYFFFGVMCGIAIDLICLFCGED